MAVPILSFFTGGGFFDLGFKQAGFSICWTNENNPAFITGYEYGMSSWLSSLNKKRHVNAKIANIKSIRDLSAGTVITEAFAGPRPAIFGVIGGPPCPDFSNGGLHAGGSGLNGSLTTTFVDMICMLEPSFFIIENVPGLYRTKKHRLFLDKKILQLQSCGYAIDHKILSALEFGVPQSRDRLFIVGFKQQLIQDVTHSLVGPDDRGWFVWPEIETYKGAKALPWPTVVTEGSETVKPADVPIELTVYPALFGSGDPEECPNGTDFFVPRSSKFDLIREGDVSGKSFKRLHRYRFSPTAWYGNQEVHLHPWKPRRLSVREAMRIQTIPDQYVLPSSISLSAKFKMIGNAVPCLLAYHVAMSVKRLIARIEGRE